MDWLLKVGDEYMNASVVLKASKNYTKETVLGGGAIVGKNVVISSITPIDGGNVVKFSYTLDDGTVKYSTLKVMDGKDGVGISKIEKIQTVGVVDTYRITFTDNTTFDYNVSNGTGSGGSQEYATNEDIDKMFV